MRKPVILFAMFLLSYMVSAQSKQVRELGLVFSNADQFGLTYRVGNEHAMWRFNGLNLSGTFDSGTQNTIASSIDNIGFGLSIGREYRLPINKQFDFRYGADLLYNYSRTYSEKENTDASQNSIEQTIVNHTPGMNLVLGFNLNLKYFILGAELKPIVQYYVKTTDITTNINSTEHVDQSRWMIGLSTSPVQFSIVYPF